MRMYKISKDDVAILKRWLDLDCENGVLRWKEKIAKKVVLGSIAGSERKAGYKCFQLMKRRFLTHRAIYAMVHGECVGEIDHINGDPTDNRPENLRQVTRSQQNMNKSPSRKNKHGVPGVCYYPRVNMYNARVRVDGKRISLGYFKSLEEAHQAYLAGVAKYHGEYRRAY